MVLQVRSKSTCITPVISIQSKWFHLGSMLVSNVQGTEQISSKINPARSAFPRLQSRREISLRTEGRVYKTVVCSILLYDCEKWLVRVGDERVLAVFDNDSIPRILHMRSRDWVPWVELWRRLCLTRTPVLVVQRRLRWFGHAAR